MNQRLGVSTKQPTLTSAVTTEHQRVRLNNPLSNSMNQAEMRREINAQKLAKSSNDVKQKEVVRKLTETSSHKKLSSQQTKRE